MSLQQTTGQEILSVELLTSGYEIEKFNIGFTSIKELYLIEDIFSFCITGRIKFYDRVGIVEFGPLNGNEKLQITYGNSNGSGKYKVITMDILKIDKVQSIKGTEQTKDLLVEMTLVDENYREFNYNTWSKAWVDTRTSDIISDISDSHLNIARSDFNVFDDSKEKIEHFDTHLRTPNECINWLMNRSSSVKSGQAGYLFYRTNNPESDGFDFNFTSIESLLSSKKFMSPIGDNNVYGFDQTNVHYINKIKNHKILYVDFTALKSLLGETLLGVDSRTKSLLKKDYSYTDALKRFTILGKRSLIPSDLELSRSRQRIDGANREDFLDNIWYGNWIREYCHQQLVEVTVTGHEDRYAGGMIRIVWPSKDERQNVLNKQMDGKYLVKSVINYFSAESATGWQQKLVCIKNGYKDSNNPLLVKATKVNM